MLPPNLEKVLQILKEEMEAYRRKEEEGQVKIYQGEIIPELACLTLDAAQTRLLYSLQQQRTLYDITQTAIGDKYNLKRLWFQQWKARILKSLQVDGSFLSGAALANASLAFLGGGTLAAGGFGMAGGVAVITGGGALLGMAGGTATAATAMSLLSTEGYALHESAKLLTFCKVILLEQTTAKTQIAMLQKTVAQSIQQFGGELALRKAEPKQDKKAISAIEKNMGYLKKCNKELLDMISKQ